MLRPKENSLLGSYRLIRALGGDVCCAEYIAEHLFLGREFRLLVLAHDDLYQPAALEAIKAHVSEFARLSHPALPHIYDVQQVNSHFFFTCDKIEGEPLRARIVRNKIHTAEEFVEFFRRISDIVLYLQSKNISCKNFGYGDVVERDGEWYVRQVNWLGGAAQAVNTEDEELRRYLATAPGPYFQKGFFDTRANIRRMGELMYEAVAWGNLDDALEIRRKEEEQLSKKKKSSERVRLVSEITPEMEEIIVSTRSEADAGGYRTLKDLFDAVSALGRKSEEKEKEAELAAAPLPAATERETVWDYTPRIERTQPHAGRTRALLLQGAKYASIVAVAVAVVVGLALLVYRPPFSTYHNREPVARAAASPRVTFVGGQIELDGSASYDPDHDELIYHWEAVEPQGAKVAFSANASRAAARVKATFSEKGKHKILLRVHDGTRFSQPAYVTVVVY
jgi:hypothetical protein